MIKVHELPRPTGTIGELRSPTRLDCQGQETTDLLPEGVKVVRDIGAGFQKLSDPNIHSVIIQNAERQQIVDHVSILEKSGIDIHGVACSGTYLLGEEVRGKLTESFLRVGLKSEDLWLRDLNQNVRELETFARASMGESNPRFRFFLRTDKSKFFSPSLTPHLDMSFLTEVITYRGERTRYFSNADVKSRHPLVIAGNAQAWSPQIGEPFLFYGERGRRGCSVAHQAPEGPTSVASKKERIIFALFCAE